jgi:hypothetical protein
MMNFVHEPLGRISTIRFLIDSSTENRCSFNCCKQDRSISWSASSKAIYDNYSACDHISVSER